VGFIFALPCPVAAAGAAGWLAGGLLHYFACEPHKIVVCQDLSRNFGAR